MPYEIGFPMILTSGAFLNHKANKQTSYIHFVHPVEKVNNMTRWGHKTLSASAIRKQVSTCCTHFPHELTCQILTNQSLKIRRRA